jgi:DNA (cytosine-5)-methyltransferase 1
MSDQIFYNDNDPFVCEWLKNLIAEGFLPPGTVSARSITEIDPDELREYKQCHFFCGIGGWPLALRIAGWGSNRPVWTGSPPCQSYSQIGTGKGREDARDLWPAFFQLIEACRPVVVLGEQISGADGLDWLDVVCADMDGAGYVCGALDTCAAGTGAPQIRQRLYWMGYASGSGLEGHTGHEPGRQEPGRYETQSDGSVTAPSGFSRVVFSAECDEDGNCPNCGIDYADCDCIGPTEDECEYIEIDGELFGRRRADGESGEPATDEFLSGALHGAWSAADWLLCRDAKWRPVEPGTLPLATRLSNRVELLRAYGNALNVGQAAAFVRAVDDVLYGSGGHAG